MRKKIIRKNTILFIVFLIAFLLFLSGISLKNTVLALTGNYTKIAGDTLGVTDWNNLDNDFVVKSGDTMQGELNMGNNRITGLGDPVNDSDSVNKGFMNSAISDALTTGSANITNTGGENLKMVCGSTPFGSTVWQSAAAGAVTTYINVSAAGFSNNDIFFSASLYGSEGMNKAIGVNNIYDATVNGFRLYLSNNDISDPLNGMTNLNKINNEWAWYIKWCGIGL